VKHQKTHRPHQEEKNSHEEERPLAHKTPPRQSSDDTIV